MNTGINKTQVLLKLVVLLVVTVYLALVLNPIGRKNPTSGSTTSQLNETKEIKPSETLKEYTDPSGFTLSYPDNLSLTKKDITDESTYADIQLTSKEVSGSLNLKISDSKFTTLEDWLKLNRGTPKEVQLGSLKGMEVITQDRLLLGALDNGVFFNIEMPLVEKDFWMKVYNKVLTNFSFVSPETANSTGASTSDVTFEGEEVVP